jgi:putative ABC transport system permease protein
MFRRYFKMTFRTMKRQKGYTFINIVGLAVGFACSMLIGLFVAHELSYDRFHVNADRIYRITVQDEVSTPLPLARTLVADFPEVECGTAFSDLGKQPVKRGNLVFYESPLLGTTNDCFQMFSFRLLQGDKASVLKEPNTVVLTRSMAQKYFQDEDPLFKSITIGDRDFRIDGVMEDVPENAHFTFQCLISNSSFPWAQENDWGNYFMKTYVMLRPGSDAGLLDSKLPDFETKYLYGGNPNHERRFFMQPLRSIHLHSHLRFELGVNGDYKNIIIFTTAAIFMIIIACINFMNLTTARSLVRVREIGVRKTVGASRVQLMHQFLGESVLLSFMALGIGALMVPLALPTFYHLIGRPIGLESLNLNTVIPCLVGFALIVGLLAGIYPAVFLSSFRPMQVMKDVQAAGRRSSTFRNALVVFQFLVSITLIIGTLTVYRQLSLIHHKDLGFDKDQVLVIKNLYPDVMKAEALKQRLLRHPDVVAVSASGNLPFAGNGRNWLVTEDADTLLLNMYFADFDYLQTLGMKMSEGRFFSRKFATDTTGLILNAHAVQVHRIQNPVGKRVTWFCGRVIPLRVIGVVEDFHFESLHHPVTSLGIVYGIDKRWGTNYVSVRVQTHDIQKTISSIKDAWTSVNPSVPFDYSFLDDDYANLYANEQRTGSVALVFCILAIAVSCLGLLGLSIFVIGRRVKEIGIRKVLGASVAGTVWLLSRQFLKWIVLAFALAVPLSLYILGSWLENFAYRVDLSIWIFLLAGLAAVTIALLTVSYHTIKAATANPAEALRCE